MYPFLRPSPVLRLRIGPPGNETPRPHPKHAHPPSVIEAARQLVVGTCLPHHVIAYRTGVNKGTISRWIEKHQWQRPPGASKSPRQPGRRYVPVLVGRALATRLRVQAERLVSAIEAAPEVDPAALVQALALLAQAREEQKVRRGRRLMPPPPSAQDPSPGTTPPRRRATWDRREAAERGWRQRYSRRARHMAWMLEKEPEKGG